MKLAVERVWGEWEKSFSILKRIELGETLFCLFVVFSFSMLSVSSSGSSWVKQRNRWFPVGPELSFSILKRIELGETGGRYLVGRGNGFFQYPQADRVG